MDQRRRDDGLADPHLPNDKQTLIKVECWDAAGHDAGLGLVALAVEVIKLILDTAAAISLKALALPKLTFAVEQPLTPARVPTEGSTDNFPPILSASASSPALAVVSLKS